MTTITADPGVTIDPADNEEWLRRIACQWAVKALTIEQLRIHLTLLGWRPVESRHAALQCGNQCAMIVHHSERGFVTHITTQYKDGEKPDVPWHSVNKGHLRTLAHRIAGLM